MLILRKLLFRPMLDFMDARQGRIAAAEAQRLRNEEHLALEKAEAEEAIRQQNEQARQEAERMVAQEKARQESQLLQKQAEEQEACAQYAAEMEAQKDALLRQADVEVKRLSQIFVSGFVS
jgi:F0F1-type ATP synthase membrane subunit b/b'